MPAAIEAHLVRSILERIDPAADKGPHKVITGQAILLVLKHQLVDKVDLGDAGLGRVTPVVLGVRRMDVKLRKSDKIFIGRVLHIEEGFEPFLA